MHALFYFVERRTQAAPVSVFSTQLDLLHRYYVLRSSRQLHAEKFDQLFCIIVLPVDGPVKPEVCRSWCVVILLL
jgi:hypothetical protein